MDMKVKNAVIKRTFLGIEDHGMMTYFLYLEGDGWYQGFGGHCCDGIFLAESMRKVLETLKIDSWEELSGTYVRIEGEHSKIHRIGHILEDRWYDITKHGKEFDNGSNKNI